MVIIWLDDMSLAWPAVVQLLVFSFFFFTLLTVLRRWSRC